MRSRSDDDIDQLCSYLQITLRAAKKTSEAHWLRRLATAGWYEREKVEKDQTDRGFICWAAELFAGAEALREIRAREFEGVASILNLCAVDAVCCSNGGRSNDDTRKFIENTLIGLGVDTSEVASIAGGLMTVRNSGVHRGITDQLSISYAITSPDGITFTSKEDFQKENPNHVPGESVWDTLELPFSNNMNLFFRARQVAAHAISNKVLEAVASLKKETRS